MRDEPKVSVVTVTLNDIDGLKRTVDSVSRQTYREFEHIIVDGGSADGTVEFCQSLNISDTRVFATSEPDDGIFDAMNKGALRASGDLLVFVNSSDQFSHDDVLKHVASAWATDGSWDWGYGALRYLDAEGSVFAGTVQAPFHPRKLELGLQFVPHPASYISRALFIELGGFDLSFGSAADQEIFVRIARTHRPHVWIEFMADFLVGGVHSQESAWSREALWHRMRKKNGAMVAGMSWADAVAAMALAGSSRSRRLVASIMKGSAR